MPMAQRFARRRLALIVSASTHELLDFTAPVRMPDAEGRVSA